MPDDLPVTQPLVSELWRDCNA